jgi:hypothetical protein
MTHPASANCFLKAGAVSEVILVKGDDIRGWTDVPNLVSRPKVSSSPGVLADVLRKIRQTGRLPGVDRWFSGE